MATSGPDATVDPVPNEAGANVPAAISDVGPVDHYADPGGDPSAIPSDRLLAQMMAAWVARQTPPPAPTYLVAPSGALSGPRKLNAIGLTFIPDDYGDDGNVVQETQPTTDAKPSHRQPDPTSTLSASFALAATGHNAPTWVHPLFLGLFCQSWFRADADRPGANPSAASRMQNTAAVWAALADVLEKLLNGNRDWVADVTAGAGELRLRHMRSIMQTTSALCLDLVGVAAAGAPIDRVLSLVAYLRREVAALIDGEVLIVPCGWRSDDDIGFAHMVVIKDPGDSFTVGVVNTLERAGLRSYHPCTARFPPGFRYRTALELRRVPRDRLLNDALWYAIVDMQVSRSPLHSPALFYEVIVPFIRGPGSDAAAPEATASGMPWRRAQTAQRCSAALPMACVEYLAYAKGFPEHDVERIVYNIQRQVFAMARDDLQACHVDEREVGWMFAACQRMAIDSADVLERGRIRGRQGPDIQAMIESVMRVCRPPLSTLPPEELVGLADADLPGDEDVGDVGHGGEDGSAPDDVDQLDYGAPPAFDLPSLIGNVDVVDGSTQHVAAARATRFEQFPGGNDVIDAVALCHSTCLSAGSSSPWMRLLTIRDMAVSVPIQPAADAGAICPPVDDLMAWMVDDLKAIPIVDVALVGDMLVVGGALLAIAHASNQIRHGIPDGIIADLMASGATWTTSSSTIDALRDRSMAYLTACIREPGPEVDGIVGRLRDLLRACVSCRQGADTGLVVLGPSGPGPGSVGAYVTGAPDDLDERQLRSRVDRSAGVGVCLDLSLEQNQIAVELLTCPSMRIPLLLAFGADHARQVCASPRLQALLYSAVFDPGAERAAGQLAYEFAHAPDATIAPCTALLERALVEDEQRNGLDSLLFLARFASRFASGMKVANVERPAFRLALERIAERLTRRISERDDGGRPLCLYLLHAGRLLLSLDDDDCLASAVFIATWTRLVVSDADGRRLLARHHVSIATVLSGVSRVVPVLALRLKQRDNVDAFLSRLFDVGVLIRPRDGSAMARVWRPSDDDGWVWTSLPDPAAPAISFVHSRATIAFDGRACAFLLNGTIAFAAVADRMPDVGVPIPSPAAFALHVGPVWTAVGVPDDDVVEAVERVADDVQVDVLTLDNALWFPARPMPARLQWVEACLPSHVRVQLKERGCGSRWRIDREQGPIVWLRSPNDHVAVADQHARSVRVFRLERLWGRGHWPIPVASYDVGRDRLVIVNPQRHAFVVRHARHGLRIPHDVMEAVVPRDLVSEYASFWMPPCGAITGLPYRADDAPALRIEFLPTFRVVRGAPVKDGDGLPSRLRPYHLSVSDATLQGALKRARRDAVLAHAMLTAVSRSSGALALVRAAHGRAAVQAPQALRTLIAPEHILLWTLDGIQTPLLAMIEVPLLGLRFQERTLMEDDLDCGENGPFYADANTPATVTKLFVRRATHLFLVGDDAMRDMFVLERRRWPGQIRRLTNGLRRVMVLGDPHGTMALAIPNECLFGPGARPGDVRQRVLFYPVHLSRTFFLMPTRLHVLSLVLARYRLGHLNEAARLALALSSHDDRDPVGDDERLVLSAFDVDENTTENAAAVLLHVARSVNDAGRLWPIADLYATYLSGSAYVSSSCLMSLAEERQLIDTFPTIVDANVLIANRSAFLDAAVDNRREGDLVVSMRLPERVEGACVWQALLDEAPAFFDALHVNDYQWPWAVTLSFTDRALLDRDALRGFELVRRIRSCHDGGFDGNAFLLCFQMVTGAVRAGLCRDTLTDGNLLASLLLQGYLVSMFRQRQASHRDAIHSIRSAAHDPEAASALMPFMMLGVLATRPKANDAEVPAFPTSVADGSPRVAHAGHGPLHRFITRLQRYCRTLCKATTEGGTAPAEQRTLVEVVSLTATDIERESDRACRPSDMSAREQTMHNPVLEIGAGAVLEHDHDVLTTQPLSVIQLTWFVRTEPAADAPVPEFQVPERWRSRWTSVETGEPSSAPDAAASSRNKLLLVMESDVGSEGGWESRHQQAIRKLWELRRMMGTIARHDVAVVGRALQAILRAADAVSLRADDITFDQSKRYAFALRRMAGHQRRVSFGYLAMCMCSTRAFDDLMRVNPFIAATHHHPLHLLDGIASIMLRTSRIGQARDALRLVNDLYAQMVRRLNKAYTPLPASFFRLADRLADLLCARRALVQGRLFDPRVLLFDFAAGRSLADDDLRVIQSSATASPERIHIDAFGKVPISTTVVPVQCAIHDGFVVVCVPASAVDIVRHLWTRDSWPALSGLLPSQRALRTFRANDHVAAQVVRRRLLFACRTNSVLLTSEVDLQRILLEAVDAQRRASIDATAWRDCVHALRRAAIQIGVGARLALLHPALLADSPNALPYRLSIWPDSSTDASAGASTPVLVPWAPLRIRIAMLFIAPLCSVSIGSAALRAAMDVAVQRDALRIDPIGVIADEDAFRADVLPELVRYVRGALTVVGAPGNVALAERVIRRWSRRLLFHVLSPATALKARSESGSTTRPSNPDAAFGEVIRETFARCERNAWAESAAASALADSALPHLAHRSPDVVGVSVYDVGRLFPRRLSYHSGLVPMPPPVPVAGFRSRDAIAALALYTSADCVTVRRSGPAAAGRDALFAVAAREFDAVADCGRVFAGLCPVECGRALLAAGAGDRFRGVVVVDRTGVPVIVFGSGRQARYDPHVAPRARDLFFVFTGDAVDAALVFPMASTARVLLLVSAQHTSLAGFCKGMSRLELLGRSQTVQIAVLAPDRIKAQTAMDIVNWLIRNDDTGDDDTEWVRAFKDAWHGLQALEREPDQDWRPFVVRDWMWAADFENDAAFWHRIVARRIEWRRGLWRNSNERAPLCTRQFEAMEAALMGKSGDHIDYCARRIMPGPMEVPYVACDLPWVIKLSAVTDEDAHSEEPVIHNINGAPLKMAGALARAGASVHAFVPDDDASGESPGTTDNQGGALVRQSDIAFHSFADSHGCQRMTRYAFGCAVDAWGPPDHRLPPSTPPDDRPPPETDQPSAVTYAPTANDDLPVRSLDDLFDVCQDGGDRRYRALSISGFRRAWAILHRGAPAPRPAMPRPANVIAVSLSAAAETRANLDTGRRLGTLFIVGVDGAPVVLAGASSTLSAATVAAAAIRVWNEPLGGPATSLADLDWRLQRQDRHESASALPWFGKAGLAAPGQCLSVGNGALPEHELSSMSPCDAANLVRVALQARQVSMTLDTTSSDECVARLSARMSPATALCLFDRFAAHGNVLQEGQLRAMLGNRVQVRANCNAAVPEPGASMSGEDDDVKHADDYWAFESDGATVTDEDAIRAGRLRQALCVAEGTVRRKTYGEVPSDQLARDLGLDLSKGFVMATDGEIESVWIPDEILNKKVADAVAVGDLLAWVRYVLTRGAHVPQNVRGTFVKLATREADAALAGLDVDDSDAALRFVRMTSL
ncbi:unnamed protein product (mitochondrion) [Plasmodiophora brassicae]|uniref:Uncharacterized protein n=1 Tax=Plasmodiophora brassicae TaxID=37360 RepID=A0A3P3YLM1_PLABS|nr:unnamed protein product [Plasmodiophora brassicae]